MKIPSTNYASYKVPKGFGALNPPIPSNYPDAQGYDDMAYQPDIQKMQKKKGPGRSLLRLIAGALIVVGAITIAGYLFYKKKMKPISTVDGLEKHMNKLRKAELDKPIVEILRDINIGFPPENYLNLTLGELKEGTGKYLNLNSEQKGSLEKGIKKIVELVDNAKNPELADKILKMTPEELMNNKETLSKLSNISAPRGSFIKEFKDAKNTINLTADGLERAKSDPLRLEEIKKGINGVIESAKSLGSKVTEKLNKIPLISIILNESGGSKAKEIEKHLRECGRAEILDGDTLREIPKNLLKEIRGVGLSFQDMQDRVFSFKRDDLDMLVKVGSHRYIRNSAGKNMASRFARWIAGR